MAGFGPTTRALLDLARHPTDDRALAELICKACVDGLAMDGAALSLLTASAAQHTLHATDATAESLEELQFDLNEGACIEAATTGNAVLVDDLRNSARTARWPVFAATVIEQTEVRALFALPLKWGAANLGVLDLYRWAPEGLSEDEQRDAFTAIATASLMMLTLRTDPPGVTGDGRVGELGPWLDPMVANRAEVHQATGMVLIQLGTSAEQALTRLRAHAFAEERLLVDVARDVVSRRLRFNRDD